MNTKNREDDYKGLFVVFEGPDFAGKGEQGRRLQKYIQDYSKYIDVLATHEPWKSLEIKRKLERDEGSGSDGMYMAELYIEDRARHTQSVIRPVLKTGGVVLCDRYKMSTCAYQWAQGVVLHELLAMHDNRGVLTPDITFLLDIDINTFEKRRSLAGRPIEKFEKEETYVEKLLSAYKSLGNMAYVDESVFGKVVIIDGNRTPELVAADIQKSFDSVFKPWNDYYGAAHSKSISTTRIISGAE